jgi:hypothetical protein
LKKVVVLGGTGDAYLVSALHAEFQGAQGAAEIVTRSRLACVPEMFGAPHSADDGLVERAEQDFELQRFHDNRLENDVFYAHPCFVRTPFRVDHLTTKPDASQADMYRMILGLDPYAPLALPRLPEVDAEPGTVTMIEDSTSWPNTQPTFWPRLAGALREAGWEVRANDRSWSLRQLLVRCAASEWVIGPQCGVMSALVTGEFPCRKTLATPNIDGNRRPEYLARETFPYGYVTKFAGRDYDVEEFKIDDDGNHEELVRRIVLGANARRLWAHDPRPVTSVQVSLPPGDFLDRLAVLAVKRERLPEHLRAAQEREYLRYAEQYRQANLGREADELYQRLRALHDETFAALDRLVPETLADRGAPHDYTAMVRQNRERVALKTEIDRICHAPYSEVKSYY